MKMFSRILSLLVIASLGLVYVGCGGGDDKSDPVAKVQLAKLEKNSWTISSVSFTPTGDAVQDRKNDFLNAKLTFSGTYADNGTYDYAFAGTMPTSNSPWQRTGNWKFVGDGKSQIVRTDDNIGIDYIVTDTQLTLKFQFSGDGYTPGPGRIEQVTGNWEFTFTK